MGNNVAKGAPDGGLTKKELERMHRRFQRLAKGGRKVALTDFQSVPELAGNPFIMRIFQLFDADQDGCLNFEEFIRAVESFGRLYSSEDKCMFAFRMYDSDGDGFINAGDLCHTLKLLNGRSLSDPQLDQIVESTIQQHDLDGDGRLSLQEFTTLLTAADTDNKLCAAF